MTDQQNTQVARLVTPPAWRWFSVAQWPLWRWFTVFQWIGLLRGLDSALKRTAADLSNAQEAYRGEQSRCALLESMHQQARIDTRDALTKLQAEQLECATFRTQALEHQTALAQTMETIRNQEVQIKTAQLAAATAEAEVQKLAANLERAALEKKQVEAQLKEAKRDTLLLTRWTHASFRLGSPPRGGISGILSRPRTNLPVSILVALTALLATCLQAQFPPPVLRGPFTTNTVAWAQTNVVSLSTTNATSKPLTNHYQDGVLTLFGLEAGANITLAHNGSNIVITGAAGGGDAGGTNARQFGTLTLTNLSGTGAVTNVVSLSTTNATSKPLTNHFENGILTLFGLEAGANVSLSMNESNIVIASTASGGLTTNANQFLGVPLSIRSGALLTNTVHWQSNALLPALIATNQPGGTIDLVTMLTTNGAGLRVTSNGAVVVRGVIGSTTNSFEVRRSNNAAAIFGVTHSNTVRIVGPSQSGYGATITIASEEGSTQNNIELFAGSVLSGRWRSDNAGNQIISAEGGGELQFNYDGASSGRIAMGVPGIGNVWYMVPSAAVAAWHGGTLRRGQITNVWDIFCRSNMTWIEVGGSDVVSLQSTSGMSSYTMFLPITNALAGQVLYMPVPGQLAWKDDSTGGGSGLTTNANQFGASVELTIKSGAFLTNMNYWGDGTNHFGSLWVEGDVLPEGVDHFLGALTAAWSGLFTADEGIYFVTDMAAGAYTQIKRLPSWKPTNSIALTLTNVQAGEVLKVQSVSIAGGVATILVTNGVDNSGGTLTTNANQFGASVELTLKSGALLTNTLFFPSNLTAPAVIETATTAQVTNLTEWRGTNSTIPISISSNANAIVYGRLGMSNAVAFRTNNIDFRLPVYQAFTNALQTNLVLQLTNVYEGVTHRIDAYGAGRLGNGRTNAWQLLCTVASGTTIYWPPGTTNGNFDVLVNSNQIVSFTFMGGLGSTNILAAYRVLEGIGAN